MTEGKNNDAAKVMAEEFKKTFDEAMAGPLGIMAACKAAGMAICFDSITVNENNEASINNLRVIKQVEEKLA